MNSLSVSHKARPKFAYTATMITVGFKVLTDLPATFIDLATNAKVNVSNFVIGRSYRLALSSRNMWAYLINHAPGVVGITIGAYNAVSNPSVYNFGFLTQNAGSFVFNGSVQFYIYGLNSDNTPYLPDSQYGTIIIQ